LPSLALAVMSAASILAQSSLTGSGVATEITLRAKETRTFRISGPPHSLQIVDIRLESGLVWIRSEESPARMLDLGGGGHLLYVLRTSEDGNAQLELRSGESLREASLNVRPVVESYSEEQKEHLHTAEAEFAVAETARRRQAGVPAVANAEMHYDLAAAEAKAAGDTGLLHWILNQKARFLMYQQSNFSLPQQILMQAAALHSPDDDAVEAMTYKTLSSCEYYMGHLETALEDANRALALYRKTGDIYWQGVVLGNLIADYSELGRNDEATSSAREALIDAEKTEDTAGVVFSLSQLANLYRLQGDPQRAFKTFREAESWSENIRYAPLIMAEIELDFGQFYADMGLWTEARLQLEHCLRVAAADSPAALAARTLLAEVLRRLHHGRMALDEYATAIATARRLKLQPAEAELHIERAQALLRLHRLSLAQKDADTAMQLAASSSNPALRIGAILAQASVQAARCGPVNGCDKADQMYRQAIGLMQQTSDREQEAIAYAGLAQIDARLDHNEKALQSIEHALTLVEHSRASLSSEVIAASYFEEWSGWYELAESVALRLDKAHPGAGYREIAFRYTERARARSMLDAIGPIAPQPSTVLSAEMQQRITANEKQIERDQAQLLTTGSVEVAAALQHLYNEQDQLAADRRPTSAQSPGEHIASLNDLQNTLLDSDSALIAFVPGAKSSARWLITRTSVQVRTLPGRNELATTLATLRRLLTERRPATHTGEDVTQYTARIAEFTTQRDRELERAGNLLLAGLPRTIKHLYIVSDGDVLSLPWSALRLPCGAQICYAIQMFTISIEPSASVVVALARRTAQPQRNTIMVVSDARPFSAEITPRWTAFTTLPGSKREAAAIARQASGMKVRALYGDAASPDNVTTALDKQVQVLHLATHTFLVPGHPELSGVALSPNAAANKNTILWLHDIPSLLSPPLVTLSGCATQGGGLSGEALKTLTQAFFYGGAQQVVASLWSVDDDATVTLMTGFYRNLLVRHTDAAESLQASQIVMLKSGADVADWAAFTINGAPAANRLSARN